MASPIKIFDGGTVMTMTNIPYSPIRIEPCGCPVIWYKGADRERIQFNAGELFSRLATHAMIGCREWHNLAADGYGR